MYNGNKQVAIHNIKNSILLEPDSTKIWEYS